MDLCTWSIFIPIKDNSPHLNLPLQVSHNDYYKYPLYSKKSLLIPIPPKSHLIKPSLISIIITSSYLYLLQDWARPKARWFLSYLSELQTPPLLLYSRPLRCHSVLLHCHANCYWPNWLLVNLQALPLSPERPLLQQDSLSPGHLKHNKSF